MYLIYVRNLNKNIIVRKISTKELEKLNDI